MGFPRQEYWSGLHFPSLGDLPHQGAKPASPALAGGFFISEPLESPKMLNYIYIFLRSYSFVLVTHTMA